MIECRRVIDENPMELLVVACPVIKQINQFSVIGKEGTLASRMRPIGAPNALVGRGRDDCLSLLKKIVVRWSLN